MTIPTKAVGLDASSIESALMLGDLSKLTTDLRLEYYNKVCASLGLNPLTRPFDYLTLNGKLTLYARRDAADQLRKINGISIEIAGQDFSRGLLTIHVRAKDRDGRQDEDLGVVNFPEGLKGEAAANAILKAVTKAKRRVTLSISGLGFLDETEIADIPSAAKVDHSEVQSDENIEATVGAVITSDEADYIRQLLTDSKTDPNVFLRKAGCASIADLPAIKYQSAIYWLEGRVPKDRKAAP